MLSEPIAQFCAVIPDLQSALTIAGDGSARIKLDVPECDLPAILRLIAFGKERALTITVTPCE